MNLLIVSSAPIIQKENSFFMYAPYLKELIIWEKNTDKIIFCCPIWKEDRKLLIEKINFKDFKIFETYDFNITTIKNIIITFFKIPIIFFTILKAMRKADHIHLRCPGNMGLLGAIAQVFFPKKKKTAKYAGNWDPIAKQPLSYKLQRIILSNTFLTKNINVLVYGEWPNQTKNIKPFFTATYSEKEIQKNENKTVNLKINFIFVGTLSKGKNPMYAIHLVEKLLIYNIEVQLELYGEGIMRKDLESYILENNLQNNVKLMGNQDKETLKKAYQISHFLILPSQSEGWPKAVAEAMFWGCVPISTSVSCVPSILDYGKRGIVLTNNLKKDYPKILNLIKNQELYYQMSNSAQDWSQKYTLEYFEDEIKKLIVK
jgi:glycosyltransferase involved in cell wall biosynthesis